MGRELGPAYWNTYYRKIAEKEKKERAMLLEKNSNEAQSVENRLIRIEQQINEILNKLTGK